MKKMKKLIILSFALVFMAGCDKDFVEINTNPQQVITLNEPGLLFTNILRGTSTGGGWDAESTIVQHFVLPYNLGATAGYQFNINNDGVSGGPWGVFTGNIRTTVHLMGLVKDNPDRSNLYNQARIWRVLHYMWLVDHYGDVPYFESVRAQEDGIFYPKYDKGSVIYDDLYRELKEATAALDPAKDNTSTWDIFVPANSSTADQITFWKRMGYSIMLRMGMRYSKSNPAKAQEIVQAAFAGDGGVNVMQTNADNAVIANMTSAGAPIVGYTNGRMGGVRGTNPFNYYLAEPIVNQLKNTSDPRLKFISANYVPFQSTAPNVTNPDVSAANQFGFPVGYDNTNLSTYPGYRPETGTGQNYSQLNYNVVANTTTPAPIITNAQVKLLLAEAAIRGWVPGGDAQAKAYYEAGVRASIDAYSDPEFPFPNVTAVTTAEKNAFLAQPGVSYDAAANKLALINTQYWVECFNNGYEAWCNFRRSGYPVLTANPYPPALAGNGFIRRFTYPVNEQTNNTANYLEGVAGLGGPDVLTTPVFWDLP